MDNNADAGVAAPNANNNEVPLHLEDMAILYDVFRAAMWPLELMEPDEVIEHCVVAKDPASGHITAFNMSGHTPTIPWDLSPRIAQLKSLNCLMLAGGVRSIPPGLATMKTLKLLGWYRRVGHNLQQHHFDVPNVRFPHVVHFEIGQVIEENHHVVNNGPTLTPIPSNLLSWVTTKFQNLQTLVIENAAYAIPAALHYLSGHPQNPIFHYQLRELHIVDCALTETDLETIVFDVLPNFPRLYQLVATKNNINSLLNLAERMKANMTSNHYLYGVHSLLLQDTPVWNVILSAMADTNHPEMKALLTVLDFLPITCLWDGSPYKLNGVQHTQYPLYPSPIVHHLHLNWATSTWTIPRNAKDSFLVPLVTGLERRLQKHYKTSIPWPKKLEVVYQNSNIGFHGLELFELAKDATSLYYFVRHGPFIVGRTDRRQPIHDATAAAGPVEPQDNHDDKKEERKPAVVMTTNNYKRQRLA